MVATVKKQELWAPLNVVACTGHIPCRDLNLHQWGFYKTY